MPNHDAKRGQVSGWSAGAARRNVAFLRSVRISSLTGYGYSLTMTVRDCPPTAADWAATVHAFCQDIQRALGVLRIHWVIEWQRRGYPHLHASVYTAEPVDPDCFKRSWLRLARAWRPTKKGQHVNEIYEVVGWMQYVAKHCARGVGHYQRQRDSIPKQWQSKTGRVWGYRGDWVCDEPEKYELDHTRWGDRGWYAWRRLVRSWRCADARKRADWRRLSVSRRMLACNDRQLCEVRGVSEWIPGAMAIRMLRSLAQRGFSIKRREEEEPATAVEPNRCDSNGTQIAYTQVA